LDSDVTQQIWIDLVQRRRPRSAGLRRHGAQAHQAHEPAYALAAHVIAEPPQMPRHLPRAVPGRDEVLLVDLTHQAHVEIALPAGAVVPAGPADAHELALSHDAEPGVFRLDHRSPSIHAHRSKALAKKSRSMTSSPTFAWSRLISSS